MSFDTCFDRLIGHEGGYVNHPKDPGGETHWGISKRAYPDVNIKTLTREGARVMYERDFWTRIHGNELADGVAWQVFDFAVNSGIETAIRYLQRAIGVADDGHWGPISRQTAAALDESDIILRFVAERLDFYTRLSTWPTFGKGWARRCADNLRYGADDS